jgi:hypothetical protein
VGNKSCFGSTITCGGASGTIGSMSCISLLSGTSSPCGDLKATVGDQSCTAPMACGGLGSTATVGDESCSAVQSCSAFGAT